MNSAFRILCDPVNKTIKEAVIAYGVVADHAIRVNKTEQFLVGKTFDEGTFSQAVEHLHQEINLSKHPESQYISVENPEGKEEFRQNLVVHFLFKFFCKMRSNLALPLSESLKTVTEESVCMGATKRPISHGKVDYEVTKGRYATPKVDIGSLVSGEAKYTVDLPVSKQTLFGAFVVGTRVGYKVKSIDVDGAKKLPGVVDVVTAKDITGANSCGAYPGEEPVFADTISFHGQPVALIVAKTQLEARDAAKKCGVEYGEQEEKNPVFGIEQAKEKDNFFPDKEQSEVKCGDVEKAFAESDHVVEGKTGVGSQLHFQLEMLNAVAVPGDGQQINVYTGVQAPDYVKGKLSEVLGVKGNEVTLISKRGMEKKTNFETFLQIFPIKKLVELLVEESRVVLSSQQQQLWLLES